MLKSIQDSKDKPDPGQAESKDNRQRGSAKKKDMKNSRAEQRVSQRRECASIHKGLSKERIAGQTHSCTKKG